MTERQQIPLTVFNTGDTERDISDHDGDGGFEGEQPKETASQVGVTPGSLHSLPVI